MYYKSYERFVLSDLTINPNKVLKLKCSTKEIITLISSYFFTIVFFYKIYVHSFEFTIQLYFIAQFEFKTLLGFN